MTEIEVADETLLCISIWETSNQIIIVLRSFIPDRLAIEKSHVLRLIQALLVPENYA